MTTSEDRWADLRDYLSRTGDNPRPVRAIRESEVTDLLAERDALAMELPGYQKAYALMQVSYGETCEERDRMKHQLRALLAERDALLAALAPFAAVARGIPGNWPDDVSVYWEEFGRPGNIRIKTFGRGADTSAPAIAHYRGAADAIRAAAADPDRTEGG